MKDQNEAGEKTLLLIRHAKSSWDAAVSSDFDRPLNDRGKRDAPVMAARLLQKGITPDLFISSPANRAFTTAVAFCELFKVPPQRIITIPSLYHAVPHTFFDVIRETDNTAKIIAVFSHNPGITAFANLLTPNVHIDNMPTCSIFAVKAATGSWQNFEKSVRSFLFFDYPKKG